MSDKNVHPELNEVDDLRPENYKHESHDDISIAPLLSDLVAFADELNTRNICETEANQKFRESQLRWQKYYVATAAFLGALTLCIVYSFYDSAARLARIAESEVKIASAQLAMFDKQGAIGEATIATMKAQMAQQSSADRAVVTANGAFPAKVNKSSQSWTELKSTGIPPRNVAVSWHNSGNSVATNFVQAGQLVSVKAGDPPPVAPECDEARRPRQEDNRTSLAPDNTMFSVWTAKGDVDSTNLAEGQMVYAVGCAYYDEFDRSRTFFSDICLVWNPGQQPEFQPCQDSNRNYVH